jgi:hypothetical protein
MWSFFIIWRFPFPDVNVNRPKRLFLCTLQYSIDGWSDGRSKQCTTEDITMTLGIHEDFSSNEVQVHPEVTTTITTCGSDRKLLGTSSTFADFCLLQVGESLISF